MNDRWASLVDGFQPTQHELALLAKHYVDAIMDIDLFWRCYRVSGSREWRINAFASRRLDTIKQALGEANFNAAIEQTLADWNQKFADVDRQEESLAPCTKCGAKRHLYEMSGVPDCLAGGLCERCVHERSGKR